MTRFRCGLLALVPLAGCGPEPKKVTAPPSTVATVDERNTNYRPGQGTLRNTLRSGERGAALNDFHQLKTFVATYETENGRMPGKDDLRAYLRGDGQSLLKKIDDGAILLTGNTGKQAVWAYEVDADTAGGIVLAGGAVERKTADEVKQLLASK